MHLKQSACNCHGCTQCPDAIGYKHSPALNHSACCHLACCHKGTANFSRCDCNIVCCPVLLRSRSQAAQPTDCSAAHVGARSCGNASHADQYQTVHQPHQHVDVNSSASQQSFAELPHNSAHKGYEPAGGKCMPVQRLFTGSDNAGPSQPAAKQVQPAWPDAVTETRSGTQNTPGNVDADRGSQELIWESMPVKSAGPGTATPVSGMLAVCVLHAAQLLGTAHISRRWSYLHSTTRNTQTISVSKKNSCGCQGCDIICVRSVT